jgi:hypothetical protein
MKNNKSDKEHQNKSTQEGDLSQDAGLHQTS